MPIYALAGLGLLAWSMTIPRDRPKRTEEHGRLGAVVPFSARHLGSGVPRRPVPAVDRLQRCLELLLLKIADQGGGPLLIGIGTALGGLVEVPTMRSSSSLQRRLGLRKVYMLGCAVYAVGFVLWGVISDPTRCRS